MSALQFNNLEICSVRSQTDRAVSIGFSIPRSLRQQYRFIAGQYLTLRAEIDGEDIRRSYSICSAVSDVNQLEVGIKQVDGGVFSNYAAGLKVGDCIDVMTPQGRFTAPIGAPDVRHDYLLIAAGSGITPCLSIIRSVLAEEPLSNLSLIYGNRSSNSIMFRDEIGALKDQYMSRFVVNHVMSRERQDVPLLNGRIDADKIEVMVDSGVIHPKQSDGIYICGPIEMTEAVTQVLRDSGVDSARLHTELFFVDGSPRPVAASEPSQPSMDGCQVTIIMDGVESDIQVDGEKQTVLQAAIESGLDMPFSCAGGMCCTCRCKISEGKVKMDVNYSLAEWEVNAGFTLACQSRPLTDTLTLDFDAS